LKLAREFSQDLANRYAVAADFAIHKPHRAGDHRNVHAHILTTTRALTDTGMGAKTGIELGNRDRAKLGLDTTADELTRIRARWTELANCALELARSDARIDHRSLKDQGIEREPTKHMGPAIAGILARGEHSHVAERWQRETNERLRLAEELGRTERENQQLQHSIIDLSNDLAAALREREIVTSQRMTPAQLREQARAEWVAYRQAAHGHPDSDRNRDCKLSRTLNGGAVPASAHQQQGLILNPIDDQQKSNAKDRGQDLILDP
jgi:hypothetical protein